MNGNQIVKIKNSLLFLEQVYGTPLPSSVNSLEGGLRGKSVHIIRFEINEDNGKAILWYEFETKSYIIQCVGSFGSGTAHSKA